MTCRSAVVSLSEAARSPRARMHADSLSGLGPTLFVGYGEAGEGARFRFRRVAVYPEETARSFRLPSALRLATKALWQAIALLLALCAAGRLDVVLIQTPPAIPTLAVCWIYCLVSGARMIVDWHNYAHSLMALELGERSTLVRLAAALEFYFGRKAHASFCVSQAMKNHLLQSHGIQSKLLYDCASEVFRSLTIKERHDFMFKLSREYSSFRGDTSFQSQNIIESTAISEKDNRDVVTLLTKRPGVLFSSTSWTVDEDFSILLNALETYDKASMGDSSYPPLLCVITGKGPMKDFYLKLIDRKKLQKVHIITPWLKQSDYPLMVASADLGVSLHTSSSGLDLPMKIVDMFGCGLPVCAYKYPCLKELVKEGENGYLFSDSDELGEQIKRWFKGFPNNTEQNLTITKFKNNLKSFQNLRWDANWTNRAKPYFL